MTRIQLLIDLARRIADQRTVHPLRVGIDGIDASGKTTLAEELREALRPTRRRIIRVSLDDFHHPAAHRHRKGRFSPEGYYQDAFDLRAIVSNVLRPLGPNGDGRYRRAAFDLRADRPFRPPWEVAARGSIVLVDGVFLHRPALIHHLDFRIFVEVSFETAVRRGVARDAAAFGGEALVRELYRRRYMPAQRAYLESCQARGRAHLIVKQDDLEDPRLYNGRPV